MNLAIRKLAMLEKEMIEREEAAKIEGKYSTCPYDSQFRDHISAIMDKVRAL